MGSEVFQLYLLLTLKDAASGGLDRVEARLRTGDKEARQYLQTFQQLREGMKRDLGTAAIGVGILALMRKGTQVAADYETAVNDLKLSLATIDAKSGAEDIGKINQEMSRAEALAVRLGNTLPGSTQDFLQMMTVLKQGGMQTERVLGGGGEAVAQLAVVTHQNPAELAKEYAQIGEMFQLNTQKDWMKAADISARLYRATGLSAEEQTQGLKFAQTRAGMNLGIGGLGGYQTLGTVLGTLRTYGLEGGFGGRELSRFLMQLSEFDKNAAKLKKTEGIDLKAKGIDLQFFDTKGAFLGFDNIFKQMEKLRTLSEQERIKVGQKVFTAEGTAIATAFMTAGEDGWRKINDRVDAVLPLEQQIVKTTDTWNAKLENVQGTLSNVGVTGFKPLNEQIKPLLDSTNTLLGYTQTFLQGHPQIVQIGTDFVVIGGVVLTVTGGVKTLITTINLLRIAQAVAAGESVASAGKVTMSLAGVRGMLSSLSTPVKIAIIATEVLWVIGELRELKQLMDEVDRQHKDLAAGSEQGYQQFEKLKAMPGMDPSMLRRQAGLEASSVFGSLNLEGTLRDQMGGLGLRFPGQQFVRGSDETYRAFFQTGGPNSKWYENLIRAAIPGPEQHPFYQADNRQAQIGLFQQRSAELKSSEVMTEFIRKVQTLKDWPEEAKQNLLKLAQESFPQSYKTAVDEYAKSFVAVSDEAKKATEGLNSLNAPLGTLPGQFANVGAAAQRLADRWDATQISPPAAPGAEASPTPKGGVSFVRPAARPFALTEFHPEVARAIMMERQERKSQPSQSVVNIHPGAIQINVPAGSRAADNSAELARMIASELQIQQERA